MEPVTAECRCGSSTMNIDHHPFSDRCIHCFLDEEADIKYISLHELQRHRGNYLVIAADQTEKLDQIANDIEINTSLSLQNPYQGSIDNYIKNNSSEEIPRDYLLDLALGINARSRFIYTRITDENTVIDEQTLLSNSALSYLRDTLTNGVIDSKFYSQIKRKKDTKDLLRFIYPSLSRHSVTKHTSSKLWKHVKKHNPEQLAKSTNISRENQDRGREFEEFFEEICRKNGYKPREDPVAALQENDPDGYKYITERLDSPKGIPDFYVETPSSSTLAENNWQPIDDCFVEVKYGGSTLSRHQKKMIPYLKEAGYSVYVLRGTRESYRFEDR